MKSVKATIAHQIPSRPPIHIAVGDEVTVGDRDQEWPAFVFVRTSKGAGWVPARHLSASSGSAVVVDAYDTTELPTEVGDDLEVIHEDTDSGWLWCRSAVGREGWVPIKTVTTADDLRSGSWQPPSIPSVRGWSLAAAKVSMRRGRTARSFARPAASLERMTFSKAATGTSTPKRCTITVVRTRSGKPSLQ